MNIRTTCAHNPEKQFKNNTTVITGMVFADNEVTTSSDSQNKVSSTNEGFSSVDIRLPKRSMETNTTVNNSLESQDINEAMDELAAIFGSKLIEEESVAKTLENILCPIASKLPKSILKKAEVQGHPRSVENKVNFEKSVDETEKSKIIAIWKMISYDNFTRRVEQILKKPFQINSESFEKLKKQLERFIIDSRTQFSFPDYKEWDALCNNEYVCLFLYVCLMSKETKPIILSFLSQLPPDHINHLSSMFKMANEFHCQRSEEVKKSLLGVLQIIEEKTLKIPVVDEQQAIKRTLPPKAIEVGDLLIQMKEIPYNQFVNFLKIHNYELVTQIDENQFECMKIRLEKSCYELLMSLVYPRNNYSLWLRLLDDPDFILIFEYLHFTRESNSLFYFIFQKLPFHFAISLYDSNVSDALKTGIKNALSNTYEDMKEIVSSIDPTDFNEFQKIDELKFKKIQADFISFIDHAYENSLKSFLEDQGDFISDPLFVITLIILAYTLEDSRGEFECWLELIIRQLPNEHLIHLFEVPECLPPVNIESCMRILQSKLLVNLINKVTIEDISLRQVSMVLGSSKSKNTNVNEILDKAKSSLIQLCKLLFNNPEFNKGDTFQFVWVPYIDDASFRVLLEILAQKCLEMTDEKLLRIYINALGHFFSLTGPKFMHALQEYLIEDMGSLDVNQMDALIKYENLVNAIHPIRTNRQQRRSNDVA